MPISVSLLAGSPFSHRGFLRERFSCRQGLRRQRRHLNKQRFARFVQWHFSSRHRHPVLARKQAKTYKFNPLKDVQDLRRPESSSASFEDDWLRRRPGQTAGFPQGGWPRRLGTFFENRRHHRHPEEPRRPPTDFRHRLRTIQRHAGRNRFFPKNTNWPDVRPLPGPAPSAPGPSSICASIAAASAFLHRSRSALGRQDHQEGAGMETPEGRTRKHCVDQAMDDSLRRPRHQVHVHHAEATRRPFASGLEKEGSSHRQGRASRASSAGGTEMTSQWIRFMIEEYLTKDTYIAPTYGNTLMGLARRRHAETREHYKIAYYAPQTARRGPGGWTSKTTPRKSKSARPAGVLLTKR